MCLTFHNQIRPTVPSIRHFRLWRDDSHVQAHRERRYPERNGLSWSWSCATLRRHAVIHDYWVVTLCDTVFSLSFVFDRLIHHISLYFKQTALKIFQIRVIFICRCSFMYFESFSTVIVDTSTVLRMGVDGVDPLWHAWDHPTQVGHSLQ